MQGWRSVAAVLAFGPLFAVVGCGPNKDKTIQDLTEERDRLRGDLDDRDRQLAGLGTRESDALRTINDLREQLRAAQESATNAPKTNAEGWVGMPGFDMISIPGEVLFDSGKATLRTAGRAALDRIVSDIRGRYVDRDVYVFGHTDNEPIKKSGWKDNWELGAERALSVTRYLVSNGVSPKNIVQASCGDARPREPNATAASKQRNRRVEFYAVIRRTMTEGRTEEPSE